MRSNNFSTNLTIAGALLLLCAVLITAAMHSSDRRDEPVHARLFVDEQASLSIEEVVRLDMAGQFEPLKSHNAGYTSAAHWVAFSIDSTISPHSWIIEVAFASLDEVDLYVSTGASATQIGHGGDMRPFSFRNIPHRNSSFRIDADSAADSVFYLRVASGGTLQYPVRLWTDLDFARHVAEGNIAFGAYYGAMTLLFLCALMAFWHTGAAVFGYFSAYILSAQLVMLSLNGFAAKLLWPSAPVVGNNMVAVAAGSAILFGCLFASDLLELKRLQPRFSRVFLLVYAAGALTILVALAGIYPLSIYLAVATAAIALPMAFTATLRAWFSGLPAARYFLVMWGLLMGSVLINVMLFAGWLEPNWFSSNVMQMATLVDVVVLALALVERAHALARKAHEAQAAVARTKTELQERLETEVGARTLALQERNEELESLASRDSLTGLLNHRTLMERVEEELAAAKRHSYSIAVIMLDLDNFKQINDQLGHQAGDRALVAVAESLRAHCRPYDVCGRYGGEEFMLVTRANLNAGQVLAERLREDILRIVLPETEPAGLSASLGLACYEDEAPQISASQLVRAADKALYEAKRSGRNRVHTAHALPAS